MRYELDLRRLLCPMPVIKTQKFVKDLALNDEVVIYVTDKGALYDIPAWAKMYHHQIIHTEEKADGEVIIELKVGEKE